MVRSMRWDDLDLLGLINELEQNETGSLMSGFALMERSLGGRGLPYQDTDPRLLTRELLRARDAGFLNFDDRSWPGQQMPDPHQDPHFWLQRVRDIQLTLAGRDRARGIVIQVPHPHSDEDDERIIPGSSLESIARAISNEYSDSQVTRFLRESGIPAAYADEPWSGDRTEYVLNALDRLAADGSANRRVLRLFIGGLLDGRLQFQPDPAICARLKSQLARQGWHLRDGLLVIGERTLTPEPSTTLPRESRRISGLHPAIRQVAVRYLDAGQLEVAVFEAFKAVVARVKDLSGLDIDGSDLMGKAFNGTPPPIQFGDQSTDLGRDIQEGYRFIFMGAIRAIRNRDAHQPFQPLSEEETLEELGLISLLLRRLDAATSSTGVARTT
jgi:uncharacterized protein (TIGR02391 family)